MIYKCLVVAAAFAVVEGKPLSALELDLFRHDVWLKGSYPEMELIVDGRSFLTDAIVEIDGIHLIGGTPILLGSSSAGGNACEATPFVLSFPAEHAPRLDGPLQACVLVTLAVEDDFLRFEAAAPPGESAKIWTWEPDAGFTEGTEAIRSIDRSRGWNELRERKVDHPADLLGYGEIADQMDVLLGADRDAFQNILSGVGEGKFSGNDYVGQTCVPHECGTIEALIYLHASDRRIYLAWKPEGGSIVVRPEVAGWPESARFELRNWAAKWR